MPNPPQLTYNLPASLNAAVNSSLEDWQARGNSHKLWARDATLWTGGDEGEWLGWLDVISVQLARLDELKRIATEVKSAGFSHLLLLGMGGSSLFPEVLQMTFGSAPGSPELHVLDSTAPAQVKRFEQRVDLANTLFIVSSKSGSTLEPTIFMEYFYGRVQQTIGAESAGSRFIAITDPGSQLQQLAEKRQFRHIFFGVPSIGGRYSALSDFGIVPAAMIGLDVTLFLTQADAVAKRCAASVPPADNPGIILGIIMGQLACNGHDKVTLVASPDLWDFGAWLEQLLAESTGKNGKGLIPIDLEPLGPPEVYGTDRLFIYLRLDSAPDSSQDAALDRLESAGQPVVRIDLSSPYDLGGEIFRWEVATAVAGAVMELHPFDQPDVEASKVATQELTSTYEQTGVLPTESPVLEDRGIKLFTDAVNANALTAAVGETKTLTSYLRAHLDRIGSGDYFCLSAYLDMSEPHQRVLQAIRGAIQTQKQTATCLGYGPRFLHSTGQAYKGGPNSGVFLQITCDDAHDLPIPGRKYTFGVVKAAQARGDFEVLADRNRRVLRVHLGTDVEAGLITLQQMMAEALA